MKAIALYNPKAGSVPADARERLASVLSDLGHSGADLVEADGADPEQQLRDLARTTPDLFIVWGGDGTLRSALSTVGQKTPNLLLLPGGTMNLLPRMLHGERTWEHVVRDVIRSPKRRALPAGDVNGQTFFCAMLAGAPARFAEARESLRRGELGKAAGEARVAIETLNTLHLDARYADGYAFTDARLPATSVIGALIGPLTRAGEGMEVAALANPTTTGALNMVWTSFFSDWRNAPGVTAAPATSLYIAGENGGQIPVIADGETTDAGDHVRVAYRDAAAQCLVAA